MATQLYELLCSDGHPNYLPWEELEEAVGYSLACKVDEETLTVVLPGAMCADCQCLSLEQIGRPSGAVIIPFPFRT